MVKEKMMRVVVFFSGNASSLKYLLEEGSSINQSYEIVGAFTDRKDAPGIKLVKAANIKLQCLDHRDWCRKREVTVTSLGNRRKYFDDVSRLIKSFEADVIMLSGFMMIITNPLLKEYKFRILNVHPADLTILESGKRKYVGMNVVAKAIADCGSLMGYGKEIRSTVHLVTKEVDGGPILFTSPPISLNRKDDPVKLQERMKRECDGPAYDKSLNFLAKSRTKIWGLLEKIPERDFQRNFSDLQVGNWMMRAIASGY